MEMHVDLPPELPASDSKDKSRFDQKMMQEIANNSSAAVPRYSLALNPSTSDYATFSMPKNVAPTCAPDINCDQSAYSPHHMNGDTFECLADLLAA